MKCNIRYACIYNLQLKLVCMNSMNFKHLILQSMKASSDNLFYSIRSNNVCLLEDSNYPILKEIYLFLYQEKKAKTSKMMIKIVCIQLKTSLCTCIWSFLVDSIYMLVFDRVNNEVPLVFSIWNSLLKFH